MLAATETKLSEKILEVLRALGVMVFAAPKEIRGAIAERYNETPPRSPFYRALYRLTERGKVLRDVEGKYAARTLDEYDVPEFDRIEGEIEAFLRVSGGAARTADIHTAIWRFDDLGLGAEHPYEYHLVVRVLRESPRFHKYWGTGVWSLSQAELMTVPITGVWAMRQLDRQFRSRGKKAARVARIDYCHAVGDAFADARGDLTCAEVAQSPLVAKELDAMFSGVPIALRIDIEVSACKQLAEREGTIRSLAMEETYRRFERGEVECHRVASAAFFNACGELFGVQGCALSRRGFEDLDDPPLKVGGVDAK